MNMQRIALVILAATMLAACGASSPVGTVDVARVVSNWSLYQNYQMQLLANEQSIAQSRASDSQKQREALALQAKYGKITLELTDQIKAAAAKVAQSRHLALVVTREGVGYGGVDITADVEKAMNITEKPTPTPSP